MQDWKVKAQAVYAILSDVYETSPWSLEQIVSDMAQERNRYFFLEEEGQVLGFLAVQDLAGELEITQIAVRKQEQGKGYGAQLMAELDREEGDIFLEVRASNLAAQGLYKAKGFQEIGRRKAYYHAPVEDAIIMKREGVKR